MLPAFGAAAIKAKRALWRMGSLLARPVVPTLRDLTGLFFLSTFCSLLSTSGVYDYLCFMEFFLMAFFKTSPILSANKNSISFLIYFGISSRSFLFLFGIIIFPIPILFAARVFSFNPPI